MVSLDSPEVSLKITNSPPDSQRHNSMALICRALLIGVVAAAYLLVATVLACGAALFKSRATAERLVAQILVGLLQRLGPTFVKFGQILGTRRDVLPRVLCDQLALLHDVVKPMATRQARDVLVAAYGPHLEDVFAEINYSPVACGSIACVYRGRLSDGSEVAVKLQRPGIRGVMAADLSLVRIMTSMLGRLPLFRGAPVREVLEHLCSAVYAQLDFPREAESLRRLHDNLSAVARLWVPRPSALLCRDSAIVMELVPGLERQSAEICPAVIRKRCGATLLDAVYRLLFVNGFVHCDLHPGNVYFKKNGQVVILDAGFTIQMSDRIRRLFGEFFMNMSLGCGRRCAEIVIESSAGRSPNADLTGFTVQFVNLVERNSRLPAKDFSLIAFAGELFDLQRRFGLRAAPELVFPLLCLLVIEGTIRDLDPEMDFQKVAEPIVMQGLFGFIRHAVS